MSNLRLGGLVSGSLYLGGMVAFAVNAVTIDTNNNTISGTGNFPNTLSSLSISAGGGTDTITTGITSTSTSFNAAYTPLHVPFKSSSVVVTLTDSTGATASFTTSIGAPTGYQAVVATAPINTDPSQSVLTVSNVAGDQMLTALRDDNNLGTITQNPDGGASFVWDSSTAPNKTTFKSSTYDSINHLRGSTQTFEVVNGQLATTISSITLPANATYTLNETLTYIVNSSNSDNITVTGTPRIVLQIGSATAYADYVSGSGTSALTFTHTVATDENAPNGTTIQSIDLNGGTLKNAAGNNMDVTLPTLGSQTGIIVYGYDTTPDSFTLTALTDVALSSYRVSNAVTVTGVSSGVNVPISITGGEYSFSSDNGRTWSTYTSSNGNVQLNYKIKVKLLSSSSYSTQTSATLTMGGVSGAFNITTVVSPATGTLSLGNLVANSNGFGLSYTYSGSDSPVIQYSVNGGAWQTVTGGTVTVTNLPPKTLYKVSMRTVLSNSPNNYNSLKMITLDAGETTGVTLANTDYVKLSKSLESLSSTGNNKKTIVGTIFDV